MAIDVGAAAIDRASDADLNGYTFIAAENPANANGKINHIEIYISIDTGTIEVASFYKTNGNVFSTRGQTGILDVEVGLNVFNAPADFTAFDINAGDYIGVHGAGANIRIEQDSSGDGKWYHFGDDIPCTDTTFSWLTDRTISLYATGTEEEEPTLKNVSDSGSGADNLADLKAFLSISESGSGIEALLGLYEKLIPDTGLAVDDILVIGEALEKLVSDSGSGIESIFGPPIPPFYKELFIKRVNYRISSQGIKCDLELGELYLPLEQEILNILRDLKNEKELLQANVKQLSV